MQLFLILFDCLKAESDTGEYRVEGSDKRGANHSK